MAWTDIRGQSLAVRILQTHLQQGRVAPAYLFVGPEGIGKRLVARELAKALNCERGRDGPCTQCGQCRRMDRRVHPDVHELSPGGTAQAIRIDEVRAVLGRIALRPFLGRSQVVMLDGADCLTEEAANALLKALEEPPGQARFILMTAKPFDCLPTIVSRCQAIRFQRLAAPLIEEMLVTAHQCAPQVARLASRLAQGSCSRAIELASQWGTYQAMVAQCGAERPTPWLEWAVPNDRKELSQWLSTAVWWLRDVVVASVADERLLHHPDSAGAIRRQAIRMDRERCLEAALQCVELWDSLEQFVSPRLVGTLLREEWLALLGKAQEV